MHMVEVSIIIPAYNAAEYLPKCIDSCLAQSFTDYEIIVVDDGSKDGTAILLENYSSIDRRIKHVSKKNEGLVCARRAGLEYAKGTFVFFIDADDYIECNTLQLLYENSLDKDIVIGGIKIENPSGTPFLLQHHNEFLYNDSRKGMLCNYLSKSITPSLCGRLIRRELLKGIITPNQITIGEDVVANILMLYSHNIRFKIINSYLYHYVQYTESMINTKSVSTLYARLKFLKWIDLYVNNNEASDVDVQNCMSEFMMKEFYAYLRDGGDFDMDSFFCTYIYNRYGSKSTFKNLPIWHIAFIILFRYFPSGGFLFRYFFSRIRFFINKFKV